ncbi:MAG: ADP-dependent NAD(P)H-hydrate dehydratase [Acidimicrobiaceae bacterium]|jgi:hydroxyethylthiazole kinase-like uncharacterized protein yjeF
MSPAPRADTIEVTAELLRDHPLPDPGAATDKNERGIVLVIGGSAETTGAVVLAGLAALRVGAGKLQLATVMSGRAPLAAAVAEARVIGLDELSSGAIDPGAANDLVEVAAKAHAVVVGTGTMDPGPTGELRDHLLGAVEEPVVILDAGALPGLEHPPQPRTVLIPNPTEMEALLGRSVDDARAAVVEASERFGTTVALRGPDTWVAGPDQPVCVLRHGHPGLATSGSGDVLAGALGGLAARGADPFTATLWAVALHAAAGRRLADRIAPVGFLARELLDELPAALDESRKSR